MWIKNSGVGAIGLLLVIASPFVGLVMTAITPLLSYKKEKRTKGYQETVTTKLDLFLKKAVIIKNRRFRMESYKILLVLLPILMISMVDGATFGINGGTSYSGHSCVDDGVDVHGQFSLQGDNLAGNCEYGGSGKLSVEETKSNRAGDSVTLVASGHLDPGGKYLPSWSNPKNTDQFTGTQRLIGKGSDIYCKVQANDRDGKFDASVSSGVGKGSIDIFQSATAKKDDANAWQDINSACGENIVLKAESSDKFGDKTDSGATVDRGSLSNYNSQAEGSYLPEPLHQGKNYVDLYAMNGAFNTIDNTVNPIGSITGDTIHSEGSAHAITQNGLTASYGVTINGGSVKGRFDSGTEVRQGIGPNENGWVIAVPMESPIVWGGAQGKITIIASEISSNTDAMPDVYAQNVVVNDWKKGYGFAEPSHAGVDPSKT